MSPFVQPLFHYSRLIIHYELGPVLLCFMVVYTTDSVVVWPLTLLWNIALVLSHQISQLTYLHYFLKCSMGTCWLPMSAHTKDQVWTRANCFITYYIMMSIFSILFHGCGIPQNMTISPYAKRLILNCFFLMLFLSYNAFHNQFGLGRILIR